MGRELRRVPLDFRWPLHKVWGGYLNPYSGQSTKCPDCENGFDRKGGRPDANAALFYAQWYGHAPFDPVAYGAKPLRIDDPALVAEGKRHVANCARLGYDSSWTAEQQTAHLYRLWKNQWSHHLIQADVDALVAAGRLWDFTRTPRDAGQALVVAVRMAFHDTNSWLPEDNGYTPTADEVNTWSLRGFGHDSCNAYTCVRARCEREGVPCSCATCDGTGVVWPSAETKRRYDEWEPEEPPEGSGYQLWETTSEGSPISPVFETLDELCEYAASECSTFGSFKATKEEWRQMLDDGFVSHREGNMIFL